MSVRLVDIRGEIDGAHAAATGGPHGSGLAAGRAAYPRSLGPKPSTILVGNEGDGTLSCHLTVLPQTAVARGERTAHGAVWFPPPID